MHKLSCWRSLFGNLSWSADIQKSFYEICMLQIHAVYFFAKLDQNPGGNLVQASNNPLAIDCIVICSFFAVQSVAFLIIHNKMSNKAVKVTRLTKMKQAEQEGSEQRHRYLPSAMEPPLHIPQVVSLQYFCFEIYDVSQIRHLEAKIGKLVVFQISNLVKCFHCS